MDIYLYCSYENAKRGFYLTRLEDSGLVAGKLSGSEGKCEKLVDRFFMYDDFHILWQEVPRSDPFPFFSTADGGIFGVRGLRGEISGRKAVGNVALIAGKDELSLLENTAVRIISDIGSFAPALFKCLSVGGPCGYGADAEALRALFDKLGKKKPNDINLPDAMREILQRSGENKLTSDRRLLRFAVYVATWEQAVEHMKPRWLWKVCPTQAVSTEKFAELMRRKSQTE